MAPWYQPVSQNESCLVIPMNLVIDSKYTLTIFQTSQIYLFPYKCTHTELCIPPPFYALSSLSGSTSAGSTISKSRSVDERWLFSDSDSDCLSPGGVDVSCSDLKKRLLCKRAGGLVVLVWQRGPSGFRIAAVAWWF